MDIQSPKKNTLEERLIERTSSILGEMASKTVHKEKNGD